MLFQVVLSTVLVISLFSRAVPGLDITVDTCDICSTHHRRHHHHMERFKACKLVSVRTALNQSLEHITELRNQLGINHNIELQAVPLNRIPFLSTDELMNSTYTQLQTIYLLESYVQRISFHHGLGYHTTILKDGVKHLLCKLGPILRGGHFFYGAENDVQCRVSESIPLRGRSESINFVHNYLQEAYNQLYRVVENINYLLVTSSS